MRDGKGCTKGIECNQCAHFPFICNRTEKPSKQKKSGYIKAIKKRWGEI